MSDRTAPERDEGVDADGDDEIELADVTTLRTRGDLEGLLALARAHRTGTHGKARDMKSALDAYVAAAELGSAEAEHSAALFYLAGGPVPQDLKEGAARLRSAAEKGSTPAKVYLGNLYELGIHYAKDAEKADVWYRAAARAAQIKDAPDSPEYVRQMAELGSARDFLALSESGASKEELEPLLRKAKAHGYGLRVREAGDARPSMTDPVGAGADARPRPSGAEPPASVTPAPAPTPKAAPAKTDATAKDLAPKDAPKKEPPKPKPSPKKPSRATPSRFTPGLGLVAFLYASLFVGAAAGAGYALTEGAKHLLLPRLGELPLIKTDVHYILPASLALFGVIPQLLVYRAGTVAKAFVGGALMAGVGWAAWGTGQAMFVASRGAQSLAFGVAGFLALLLALGVAGGAKPKREKKKPSVSVWSDVDDEP